MIREYGYAIPRKCKTMEQMFETRQAGDGAKDRALSRQYLHASRIFSGELEGFGSKVKKVILCDQGRACTDGETIWIPQTIDENEIVNHIARQAVLAHENAHHAYTDFVAWNEKVVQPSKKGACDPLLHQFVNLFEDARINALFRQDFPGAGRMFDFTHDLFMGRHQKTTTDMSPLKQQGMVALMSEVIAGTPHWFTSQEVIDFMVDNKALIDNAWAQPDTAGVIKQAQRVLDAYRAAFPDEELDPDMNGGYDGNQGAGGQTSAELEDESDIERAAEAQQQQGRNPKRVSRNRFDEQKARNEERAEQASQGGDQGDSGDETGDAGASGDEIGEDADSGDGAGSEGSDDGDDAGQGDSGEGDADGDGSGDGDGDGDGDGAGSDGEAGDGPEGNGDETDSNGDSDNGRGADFNPEGDADTSADREFEEMWADLQADARASLDAINTEALDEEDDFKEDLDRAIDSVPAETGDIRGHAIEVIGGASDLFHYDLDWNIEQVIEGNERYNTVKTENHSGINTLVSEIKRQLKGRNSKFETNLKRGKVNNRDIWKSNQKGSPKMFKRRNQPKKTDASAIILIDSSGSMGGSKSAAAADAAVVFSEIMERVGVKYEVIDFATSGGQTSLRIRKAMNTNLGETEKAVVSNPTSGGCNADGYAIQWCFDRLKRERGAKMLFVLSDGQPTDGGPGNMNAKQWLKSVVDSAPRDVAVGGVGIMSPAVIDYYSNHVVVNNPAELCEKMLPVLRTMLKKVR